MAASWGGKDNGFGLAKCCSDDPIETFPDSATTLHFEFYGEVIKPAGPTSSEVVSPFSLPAGFPSTAPVAGNVGFNTVSSKVGGS